MNAPASLSKMHATAMPIMITNNPMLININRVHNSISNAPLIINNGVDATITRNEIIPVRIIFFLLSWLLLINSPCFSQLSYGIHTWILFQLTAAHLPICLIRYIKAATEKYRGNPLLRSHFETVLSLIPSISSNCFWVSTTFLRSSPINLPILI